MFMQHGYCCFFPPGFSLSLGPVLLLSVWVLCFVFFLYFSGNISTVVTGDGVAMCISSTVCRELSKIIFPSLQITVPFAW